MKQTSFKILSIIGYSLLSQSVMAGVVTDIQVSGVSDNQRLVKIVFSDNAVHPDNVLNQSSGRQLILDLPKSQIHTPQKTYAYNDRMINEIVLGDDNRKARFLLKLNQDSTYSVEKKNAKEIWIKITEGRHHANYASPRSTLTEVRTPIVNDQQANTAQNAGSQVSVSFKKNEKGAGIIELGLPAGFNQPKIRKSTDKLTLEFTHLKMNPASQKVLDVQDFSTPVSKVSLTKKGNSTFLEITSKGDWAYEQSNSNTQFVITVSPRLSLFSDNALNKQDKSFKGGKITLDFQDVDVRTVLQILAKESGMNIVASDSVVGKITINLKDVPWDQALDLVMQARNLDMRRHGNVINIAPRAELMQQDREISTAQKEAAENGPLLTQTFQLKYKRVEDLQAMLDSAKNASNSGGTGNSNSFLTGRGSTMIDLATNTLIVTDTQKIIDKFDRLIKQLDIPLRQVMIEARIVEAEDGFMRDLGLKFGAHKASVNGRDFVSNSLDNAIKDVGAVAGYKNSLNKYYDELNAWNASGGEGSRPSRPDGPTFQFGPNINLPVAAATSTLAFVRQLSSVALGLELQASQTENKTKTISSPRVLTQDRQEASLEEGIDFPYQESTSSGATSTTFKKAVTGITVMPQITPDGNIIMKLKVNKDNITNPTNGAMSVKRVETTAMVENGGTMVVGGIYVEQDTNTSSKVPLLGDIPVLGNLFKSNSKNKAKREMLIFITPRIIDTTGHSLYY